MSPKICVVMMLALLSLSIGTARRIQASQFSQSGQEGLHEALTGLMTEEHKVSQEEAELVVKQAEKKRVNPENGSIAVFGGTGGLGSEVVYQALQRGEAVVTLARDPSQMHVPEGSGGVAAGMPLTNDALTVFQGSVTNKADVNNVFADQNVKGVIVALGGRASEVGPTMLQDGTANIIAACKANGVKRIAVVTTIGAGDSYDQAPFAFRIIMRTIMKTSMADKNAQEQVTMNDGADLDYTIVRPARFSFDPPTGVVTAGNDQDVGEITRADTAAFCLDAVLEPDFKFLKHAVSIASNMGMENVLSDRSKSRLGQK